MVDYAFSPQAAVDVNTGELIKFETSGQFFALDDPTLTTPIEVTLRGEVTSFDIPVSSIGQSAWFRTTDHAQGWFAAGTQVALLTSLDGYVATAEQAAADAAASLVAALAAQAAAEAAQAAAEAVQVGAMAWDSITGKPGVFPPSAHSHPAAELTGVVKTVNGSSPDVAGNVVIATGGGGGGEGGVSSWNELLDKPSTFPPSSHSHPAAQISDSSPAGRTVLTSADPVTQRNAIGAGRSSVTVSGAYTGAAAPASHTHSKVDVGLSNVDNTSDVDKPVSVAQAQALSAKADVAALSSLASSALRFVDSITGSEPRPSGAGRVVWIGGSTQPANMADGDVWWGEAA